jgi:hypothetical protein
MMACDHRSDSCIDSAKLHEKTDRSDGNPYFPYLDAKGYSPPQGHSIHIAISPSSPPSSIS